MQGREGKHYHACSQGSQQRAAAVSSWGSHRAMPWRVLTLFRERVHTKQRTLSSSAGYFDKHTNKWRVVLVMAETPCDSQKQFRKKDGRCCNVCDAGRFTPAKRDSFRRWTLCRFSPINPLWLHRRFVVSPGSYLKKECDGSMDTQCVPCEDGLYTATKNHMSSCHHCRICSPGKSDNTVLHLLNRHMNMQRHAVNHPLVHFIYAARCFFVVF